MFSLFARTIPRRALAQPVRFMSQKPPSKRVKSTPAERGPKTAPAETPAETPAAAPVEPPTPAVDAAEATPLSTVPTLDFSPPEYEPEAKTTGAKSSKGSLSTNERKRRFMSRVSLAVLTLGFTAQAIYMGREWEEDELKGKKIVRSLQVLKVYAEHPAETGGHTDDAVGPHKGALLVAVCCKTRNCPGIHA